MSISKLARNSSRKYNRGKEHASELEDFHTETEKDLKEMREAAGLPLVSSDNTLKKLANNWLEKDKNNSCESFDLSLFPIVLHNYITSICATTNAPPIIITGSVITTISAFMGKRFYIEEYYQTLYANIWIIAIAGSGQFKSTALNKGAAIAFEQNKTINANIKELKRKNLDDAEERILQESRKKVILPNKITPEALIECLSLEHNGAIFESEFGAWLKNFEKSHNTDLKAIFTNFYDVPESYCYKNKAQEYIIEKPFISIFGVSTITWINSSLKPADFSSGFAPRFLLIYPPKKEYEIPPALPSKQIQTSKDAEIEFRRLINKIEQVSAKNYKLPDESKKLFEEIHVTIFNILLSYGENNLELLEAYAKRWSPYILKIAMIMRSFEDPDSDELSKTSLNAAMNFVSVAIKSTLYLLSGALGESEHQLKCRELFEYICKTINRTGCAITKQKILTSRQLKGGAIEYDYVLNTLEQQGKIICIPAKAKKDYTYEPSQKT